MKHLDLLHDVRHEEVGGKSLEQRTTGRFYTPEAIGRRLARQVADALPASVESPRVIDPFSGDGRLVAWIAEALDADGRAPAALAAWDHDPAATRDARRTLRRVARSISSDVRVSTWAGDSFGRMLRESAGWDIVITNPPWEMLKPDRRELERLGPDLRDEYVRRLREFDSQIAIDYPISQPSRKFAGWGTNLSRPGVEGALRLLAPGGVCGAVCPSSLMADSTSERLRQWLLEEFVLLEVTHFPAEARLFPGVDVPCCSFIASRTGDSGPVTITRFSADSRVLDQVPVALDREWLAGRGYSIPVQLGGSVLPLLAGLDHLPTWASLEGDYRDGLWAGREIDETGRANFTLESGTTPFARSIDIQRLRVPQTPSEFLDTSQKDVPTSVGHQRLAWRDISRPSQARRVHATLLPAGIATGNSVSVAYFRDDDEERLLALLAVASSIPFEIQVRSLLMTNHVSLSIVRMARVPVLDPTVTAALAQASRACLANESNAEEQLEIETAHAYGVTRDTWAQMAQAVGLPPDARASIMEQWGDHAR